MRELSHMCLVDPNYINFFFLKLQTYTKYKIQSPWSYKLINFLKC